MRRDEDKVFYALNPAEILSLLCYGEARGEKRDGQIAVMWTVKNRVAKGGWYLDSDIFSSGLSGYHAVALKNSWVEKRKKFIYQFSCFQEGDANRRILIDIATSPIREKFLNRFPAWEIINGEIPDLTNGATHYYNPKVCKASWAKDMTLVATIGNHMFMKEVHGV